MRLQILPLLISALCCACGEPVPSERGAEGVAEAGATSVDATGPGAPPADAASIPAQDSARPDAGPSLDSGPNLDSGPSPVAKDGGADAVIADAAIGVGADASAPKPSAVGHPHRFIASVHGGGADKLVYVDTDNAKQNWELAVPDGVQDFQLIGNNKLLVGYKFNFGYLEVDLATHKIDVEVRDFLTRSEAILTSVKRLENGHTLIMAQGLKNVASGAPGNLEVWEVDNKKTVHQMHTFKGCCGNLRVVRLTTEGHYLVGGDSALVELDQSGVEVARMKSGGSPTYMGLKTADGTYYATNGHGGQLVAFAPGGQRRVIGGVGSASAQEVAIYQPGQFQILQNGNIVITNWTAENGGKGKQLVEYDPSGKLVWSWDDPAVRPQGMETLLVLDNLDPAVLNDDRDGVLTPHP
jgi:hypothetical protein